MIQIGSYTFHIDTFGSILLYAIVVFVIAWIFSIVFRLTVLQFIKLKNQDKEAKTSILFLKNSIKFFVYLFAIIFIILTVPTFRSKAAYIFSGAGILAAIIGFAAQSAISNLIAGVFIVSFRPFRVGDYIKLDESRVGIVEDITLRHTVINNFENKRLIIPNSIISTESILNHNIEDSYVLSFNNFKIGLRSDIDLARKIILEEADKLPASVENNHTLDDKSKVVSTEVRVIEVNENFIHLRAYIWINDPFSEFKMKCLLAENAHKRFVAEGIDLPIRINQVIKDD